MKSNVDVSFRPADNLLTALERFKVPIFATSFLQKTLWLLIKRQHLLVSEDEPRVDSFTGRTHDSANADVPIELLLKISSCDQIAAYSLETRTWLANRSLRRIHRPAAPVTSWKVGRISNLSED